MNNWSIKHQDGSKEGSFYVEDDDVTLAELTYVKKDNHIVINHTSVDTSLQGKGLGKELVLKAVEYSKREGFKILPVCSYAQTVLERMPEVKDLLI